MGFFSLSLSSHVLDQSVRTTTRFPLSLPLGPVAQVLPLQEEVYLPKGGPGRLVPPPALLHEVRHLPEAAAWTRQLPEGRGGGRRRGGGVLLAVVQGGEVGDDGLVGHGLVRLLTRKRQDLPQGHSERPHVALRSELALEEKVAKSSLVLRNIFL